MTPSESFINFAHGLGSQVGDLGLATSGSNHQKVGYGTYGYIAPEWWQLSFSDMPEVRELFQFDMSLIPIAPLQPPIVQDKDVVRYDHLIDVWSLAMILVDMVCQGVTIQTLIYSITHALALSILHVHTSANTQDLYAITTGTQVGLSAAFAILSNSSMTISQDEGDSSGSFLRDEAKSQCAILAHVTAK